MPTVEKIDARGLSCPQPALLARDAMRSQDSGAVHILVDSTSARDNIIRVAQKAGWQVAIESQPNGVFQISLTK